MGTIGEISVINLSLKNDLHQTIQSYTFDPLVNRLARDLEIDDQEARQLFSDLKTWMYMCSVCDKPLSPPKKIDNAWHEFILFTREYADFCQRFCGGFIHHVPFDGTEEKNIPRNSVQNTKAIIEAFGISGGNWEFTVVAMCGCDTGCEDDCSKCRPLPPR